jgi:hypothetical protein
VLIFHSVILEIASSKHSKSNTSRVLERMCRTTPTASQVGQPRQDFLAQQQYSVYVFSVGHVEGDVP